MTYVEGARVFAIEADNRLAARFQLDAVLRSKPGDDLDTICRHGQGGRHTARLASIKGGKQTTKRKSAAQEKQE